MIEFVEELDRLRKAVARLHDELPIPADVERGSDWDTIDKAAQTVTWEATVALDLKSSEWIGPDQFGDNIYRVEYVGYGQSENDTRLITTMTSSWRLPTRLLITNAPESS